MQNTPAANWSAVFLVIPKHIGELGLRAEGVQYIHQGYWLNEKGKKRRVRSVTDLLTAGQPTQYEWAKKKRFTDLDREETERLLTPEDFMHCWPRTEGWRVVKHRLAVPYNAADHTIDLFFGGQLPIGEVEFKSEEEAGAFVIPDFYGSEITGLKGWGSAGLAHRPPASDEIAAALAIAAAHGPVQPR